LFPHPEIGEKRYKGRGLAISTISGSLFMEHG
jgi:hypothetical protein